MPVSKELLEILACPACKAGVQYNAKEEKITCTECGRAYPIKDDIPVMLLEEAELPEGGEPKEPKE